MPESLKYVFVNIIQQEEASEFESKSVSKPHALCSLLYWTYLCLCVCMYTYRIVTLGISLQCISSIKSVLAV
jgi:hypothetical protein